MPVGSTKVSVVKMDNLFEIRNLSVLFPIKSGFLKPPLSLRAVHNVSFDIKRNEVVGLVGESGSGKTTTGKAILRLIEPSNGRLLLNGEDIMRKGYDLKKLRKENQIVFQDPLSSLNPQKTILQALQTPMTIHGVGGSGQERRGIIEETLASVGLGSEVLSRYPHEFSGGQLQRLCIARSLVLKPSFIVCDEAIASLDVSIQSQIINLFKKLKGDYNLTYLFISHNIAVLKYLCDQIGIMYLGEIVEFAPTEQLFENAQHPYTKALLSVIPEPNPRAKETGQELKGEIPSPINPPPGCSFSTRCPYVFGRCKVEVPQTVLYDQGHRVACHLVK